MPKLGALKDLFPSMCDAFQLPDLLLDSLFNPNVSYMDNHALHCSEPGLCLSFQSRRSPLQEAPHWCPRCKMWETSCPVTPPPSPDPLLRSQAKGPEAGGWPCLPSCSPQAARSWFSCSKCSTRFWISSCCLQVSEPSGAADWPKRVIGLPSLST